MSYIERYPIREKPQEALNAGRRKLESDERCHPQKNPMPFGGMRMIFGELKMIVNK